MALEGQLEATKNELASTKESLEIAIASSSARAEEAGRVAAEAQVNRPSIYIYIYFYIADD